MLLILPILAFCLTFLFLLNLFQGEDWRRLYLAAVLLFSGYLAVTTELLSLWQGVTPAGLSLIWLLPILAFTAWLFYRAQDGSQVKLPPWRLPKPAGERILLGGILIILLITFTVALIAPPHTWDSLNYHMPRVAQWAQNRSVRPFITGIDVQNSMPPLSEMMILHTYVLSRGDRFANLVQWLAMLSSLILVSLIAQQLGTGRMGQWLAALATAAIPMGIAQSSSAQTDYTAGLFILAAASEVLRMAKGKPETSAVFLATTAAGLALLTKQTSVAYLIPLGIFAALILMIKAKPPVFLRAGLLSIVLVLLLNAGQLARNFELYGHPLYNPERMASHSNQLHTPQGWISNILRNAALHTGTPFGTASKLIYDVIVEIHGWMGLDVNDPRTTIHPPFYWVLFRRSEDLTGNFFHAGLSLASFLILLFFRKRFDNLALIYAVVTALTFVIFSGMFKWQPYGTRYHLAFFLLFTPLVAYTAARILPGFAQVMLGVFLLVAAYPWLFSLDARPIITTNRSLSANILTVPREELYFVTGRHVEHPYQLLAQEAKANNCSKIGLMLFGNEAEYPLWALMDAPKEDVYFEWIVAGPTSKYETPDFRPCALICQGCEGDEWQEIRGLQRVYTKSGFHLYFPAGTLIDYPQ